VYGKAETFPIAEDSLVKPVSPYGTHKSIAEQLIQSYCRQFEIPASLVRLFSVYGNGLRKQLLWDACGKVLSGESMFLGTGDEVRDWLHVVDAASLLLIAADRALPLCPVVNGGTGEGVSVRELLTHLARELAVNPRTVHFSGQQRAGDPHCYIADIERAANWQWSPKIHWLQGVSEYTRWWQGLSRDTLASVAVRQSAGSPYRNADRQ